MRIAWRLAFTLVYLLLGFAFVAAPASALGSYAHLPGPVLLLLLVMVAGLLGCLWRLYTTWTRPSGEARPAAALFGLWLFGAVAVQGHMHGGTVRGLRDSRERLQVLREKLAAHRAAQKRYPDTLDGLLAREGAAGDDAALLPGHRASAAVRYGAEPDDAGGWLYDKATGRVGFNCTHKDNPSWKPFSEE